jgi:prepilin-type N-terminal cleavage/methylation domain-containing protein
MKKQNKQTFRLQYGFTLAELIVVVFILSIAALVAVPMFSSAADIQVRATANRIAADLDYARGLAITRQKDFWVEFNDSAESYELWWNNPTSGDDEIFTNPLTNLPFSVDLTTDSRTGGVKIDLADFGGDTTITFDYLGTPYAGIGSAGTRLNAQGVINLESRDGSFVLTVKVEPMTGYVTIE